MNEPEELVFEEVPGKRMARRHIKQMAQAELERLLSNASCDPAQLIMFHHKYAPYLGHMVLGRMYIKIAREL